MLLTKTNELLLISCGRPLRLIKYIFLSVATRNNQATLLRVGSLKSTDSRNALILHWICLVCFRLFRYVIWSEHLWSLNFMNFIILHIMNFKPLLTLKHLILNVIVYRMPYDPHISNF